MTTQILAAESEQPNLQMSVSASRSGRQQPMQHEQQARARWTISLTKALVDLMVDQVHQKNSQKISAGNRWKLICDEFYQRTGLKWDKEQLKYRCAVLKKLYASVKSLLGRDDFTWDEKTGVIVAKDDVWDNYIKDHPDADTLRSSGCLIYKQLCILFSESARNETTNGGTEKGGATDHTSNLTEDISIELEEVAYEQEKSQFVEPTINIGNKKRGRKGFEDALADAILEMASASKMRAEATRQCGQRYSVSKCVNALDELQGVDEKLYFAALDLFKDSVTREIFLCLREEKRLIWLQGAPELPTIKTSSGPQEASN